MGAQKKLKLKGQLEYVFMDIDPSDLKGKLVTSALLHVRSASPEKAPLARVGVSSVATKWIEGTSKRYRPQIGSSCFLQAEHDKRNWAYPGSTLMDVVFGRGHTIWKFAECTAPDADGWQVCAVDPDIIAARVAGLSHGLCLFDEVGHIWSQKDGRFEYTYFPNRMCYSRESRRSAPWIEVWTQGEDKQPPESVKLIKVVTEGLPPGEALISWQTPADRGGGKVLGFEVRYARQQDESAIPRYLIPMAGKAGGEVRMHIQDLPFASGEIISLIIRAVDSAGNVGAELSKDIRLSANPQTINLPKPSLTVFESTADRPEIGGLKVAVVDLVDKIVPRNGVMLPYRPKGYKVGNHLFSADDKTIRIQAARNETVFFQVNLEGQAENIEIEYRFNDHPNLIPKIYQFAYVKSTDDNNRLKPYLPDPLLFLENRFSIPSVVGQTKVPDQSNHSLICELYVPHGESPGQKKGALIISTGNANLELDVDLTVWSFTLPNKLSFIPEMNAYGTVSPYKEYDYYRLAHEHRTCINRLLYGWHGLPEFAPVWDGKKFDWDEWDKKTGPLLDGSAFGDLPRKNEPVDVFYLPFSENWPVNNYDHFTPSYWAEEAFDDAYRKSLGKSFTAFARYCNERQWYQTIFQFYLNNKVYHRRRFPKNSAPWIFDEPVNTQDFWALRWYGLLWQSAVQPVKGEAQMWYRGDISFSQFGRNILWGIADVEYFGGNDAQKTRMKHDQQILHGEPYFAEYGTANKIEASNLQPLLWCLSAWSKGAMGVLPWQTIGTEKSWVDATQTALFYPHPAGPKPSVRLKAFTRGQQDVEYLEILCNVLKVPKYVVVKWLKEQINLEEKYYKTDSTDAGTAEFKDVTPIDLWKLRYRIGEFLSKKAPPYRRALVEWEQPKWNPETLPDIGYVRVAPQIESYKPDCDSFRLKD